VCNRYLVEQLITPGSIPAFSVGEEMRCGTPVATFYPFCCHLPSHLLPPSITTVATFHHFCCHLPSHLLPPSLTSVATFHSFCCHLPSLLWIGNDFILDLNPTYKIIPDPDPTPKIGENNWQTFSVHDKTAAIPFFKYFYVSKAPVSKNKIKTNLTTFNF
jgi:hypothetical protein